MRRHTVQGGPVPNHPSFTEMTVEFARIGCLGFGGPAGQIALMHKMLVEEKRWISGQDWRGPSLTVGPRRAG